MSHTKSLINTKSILDNPVLLEMPKWVKNSAWTGHIPFAFFLIGYLRPKVVVELGVHSGTSFSAFCQAVKSLNLDTTCYGIDTWKGDSQTGIYSERIYDNLNKYHTTEYKGISKLIPSTFDEAKINFQDESIDLLHIDGLHTYEAVKHDFFNWLPKLKKGGIVLFHDTQEKKEDFGVWQFWEELKKIYPAFEFKFSSGLGIIVVGESRNTKSFYLLNQLTKNETLAGVFERLSTSMKLAHLNNDLNAKLYYDTGQGFNELEVVAHEFLDKDIEEITFNLSLIKKNIQGLRFDPMDSCGVIEMSAAEIFERQNKYTYSYKPNAQLSIGNTFVFTTDDPNFIVNIPDKVNNFSHVRFKMKVIGLGKDSVIDFILTHYLLNDEHKTLQIKKIMEELTKKEELLSKIDMEYTKLLKEKDQFLGEIKNELNHIIVAKNELLLQVKDEYFKELADTKYLFAQTKFQLENEIRSKEQLLMLQDTKWEKEKEQLLRLKDTQWKKEIAHKEQLFEQEKADLWQELGRLKHVIERNNEGTNLFKIEYYNLKNSFSTRLGFFMTAPFRWVYDVFEKYISKEKFGVLFKMASIGVSKPKAALTMVNKRNLQTLSTALKNESPEKIRKNLNNLANRTEKILTAKEASGQDDIIYVIDECSLIDDPGTTENLLTVRGWATSYAEIEKIEIASKGKLIRVEYGRHRPDVKDAYPKYLNSEFSEFYICYILEKRVETINITISNQAGKVIEIAQKVKKIQDYSKLNLDEQYRIHRIKNKLDSATIQGIRKECESFQYRPKISIVTPVYNVAPKWLDLCFESVVNQYYDNWEFCLYDDASPNEDTIECLKEWSKKDKRILVEFGKENQHISGASNGAIKLATGEFIALLDNDDELTPDALYEVVKLLNQQPNLDYIYSDEDKLTLTGELIGPHFKPDWSPETFESMMYPCHLGVFRRSKIEQIGGFRKGYEGSQDYDLVLRFTEIAEEIAHIPKILYHWRMIPGSAAASVNAKSYAYVAAKKALAARVRREGLEGEVLDGYWTGSYRIRRKIPVDTTVGIIIPFKDQIEVTIKCVDAVLKSSFNNFEVLLVSNSSQPEELQKIKHYYKSHKKVKIYNYDIPFNYSKINNWAVSKTNANYLLFLNNDTEVINEDWLEGMLELAIKEGVGAVGAKLIYPNGTLQHAGVVLGIYGVANHPFKSLPADDYGYFGYASVAKNCAAVTGACLLVKKDKFLEVDGFDEINLPVSYNDIDLCLKLLAKGYRTVYTPYASLYHYESYTRKTSDYEALKEASESKYMYDKWGQLIECDPYYNCNLTLYREDYSLRI